MHGNIQPRLTWTHLPLKLAQVSPASLCTLRSCHRFAANELSVGQSCSGGSSAGFGVSGGCSSRAYANPRATLGAAGSGRQGQLIVSPPRSARHDKAIGCKRTNNTIIYHKNTARCNHFRGATLTSFPCISSAQPGRQLSKCNSTHVYLRNILLASEGTYKCEVSVDSPSFATVSMERRMKVYGK